MRFRLNWGRRIILQFVLVMTPLFALLGVQDVLDLSRANELANRFPLHLASTKADQHYAEFVNGVVDAVDTGKLGLPALQALAKALEQMGEVVERAPSEGNQRVLAGLKSLHQELQKQADLKTLMGTKPAIDGLRQQLLELREQTEKQAKDTIDAGVRESILQVKIGSAVALVLAGATVVFLYRMVSQLTIPLNQSIAHARAISQGNIRALERQAGNDETSQLLNALADMADALRAIVSQVDTSAGTVNDTSEKMSVAAGDLSERVTRAANRLTETTHEVIQLAATSDQSAQIAKRATQLTDQALDQARAGSATVKSMHDTMQEIAAHSKRIDSINGLIESIAFQTNILALNAAVEAARAGEHGRGFAVVASEVRALAQRSTLAAKEIKQLVSGTMESVGRGETLAGSASSAMALLLEQVQNAREMIEEANAKMAAEVTDINGIGHVLSSLDTEMQDDAQKIQRSAEASAMLTAEAQSLLQAIHVFRTE